MIATAVSINQTAQNVFDLTLNVPAMNAMPKPGQFAHVKCGEHQLRRPISIAGFGGNTLRIVFAVKGDGTLWLSRVKRGQNIDILAPLGSGYPTKDTPTLLIGGGIGVPPLLFASSALTGFHAVVGFRSAPLAVLHNEFPKDRLTLLTDDGSLGQKGYPHEHIEQYAPRFKRIFACGAKPLLEAVAAECKRLDLECWLSYEERMACGVGACLVCSCNVGGSMKRICKDGPVFKAHPLP